MQTDHQHRPRLFLGCLKLFGAAIGGANTSALFEAAKTCGPAGEWKRRVAEDLSAMYFQGGWEAG